MKKDEISVFRSGCGEPLVLLHGWGMNSSVFDLLRGALEPSYTLYRVDLPGHGRSAWDAGASFERQVASLAARLPARATLLGWSLGGMYAMEMARRYPQQFRRLVLVCCNPCFVQREGWPCAVEPTVFTGFGEDFIIDWRVAMKRFLGLQLLGGSDLRRLIRQVSELLVEGGEPSPEALNFGLELLLKRDMRAVLGDLEQPVMVVLGSKDRLVPVALEDYLYRISPAIRVECLAQASHAPFLSDVEKLAGLISEFVESPPPGQDSGQGLL